MGYWRTSSSPYEVQARNGRHFTFETIAKHYEETKPLRGKRKEENVRPVWERNRYWERMIKVSDTEYYVTFDSYTYRKEHNKAITWKLEGGMEYLTIHTPKAVWRNPDELHPRALSASSTFWFYHFNLPHGFGMLNYQTNKYVSFNGQYYTIEKGDIVFQRKQGAKESDWQPLVLHREFKHTLDRKQTKELRKLIEPFLPYYDVMCDIVQGKSAYGNAIFRALSNDELKPVHPDKALALFKQTDEVPSEWLTMVEFYKAKIENYHYDWKTEVRTYTYDRHLLKEKIARDLFQIVRPCKTTAVPLGKVSNDKYANWYK